MKFDPNTLSQIACYKLMTGTVLPRPIGWISTVDQQGVNNLAPFSFFNAVSGDPLHVLFCTERQDGAAKDTLTNVLATGEFVVNLVSEPLAAAMHLTATVLPAEVDEFVFAGVTPVPSDVVAPPRVGESPVSFECVVVHTYELENSKAGGSVVVIGRVVMFHIDDHILLDNYKIDVAAFKPVGRLAGRWYARVNDLFQLERLSRQK